MMCPSLSALTNNLDMVALLVVDSGSAAAPVAAARIAGARGLISGFAGSRLAASRFAGASLERFFDNDASSEAARIEADGRRRAGIGSREDADCVVADGQILEHREDPD